MTKLNRSTRLLLRKMNKAFRDYPMLSDGDRVAVAVSGGHDSMSLLRLLQIRRSITKGDYELIALHVLGGPEAPDANPPYQPLIDWLESTGLKYVVEPIHLAEGEHLPMDCQRCTWNRRTTLFKLTSRLGCNKLALGHHLDDMVETALMNLLYEGRMASMYPYAEYFGGRFSLIRPMMYMTQKELDNFALANGFPDPPPVCSNSRTSKRKVIAEILDLADGSYQNMRANILRAALKSMEGESKKVRRWQKMKEND